MEYKSNGGAFQLSDKPREKEFEVAVNPYDSIESMNRKGVIIRGAWKDEYLEKMEQEKITALYLNMAKKWRPENYSFLENLSFVEELHIIDMDMEGLSAIEKMGSLRELSIEGTTQDVIDFSKLQNLKKCYLSWKKGYNSIFHSVSLEVLSVYYDTPKPKDYLEIGNLVNLKKLSLNGATIRDLSFLRKLTKLCWLEFVCCRTLEDFSLIGEITTLIRLSIIDSLKLKNLQFVEHLENLKLLEVSTKTIESLFPIENIQSLEYVYLYKPINILDGDLKPLFQLQKLKDIELQNKKHYNYKEKDVLEHIKSLNNSQISDQIPMYEQVYMDTKKWCKL